MPTGYFRYLCLGLLIAFSAAFTCYGQISEGLRLRQESERRAVPRSGEYKLSLGSQMFAEEPQSSMTLDKKPVERSRFEIVESFSDLNSPAFSRLSVPVTLNLKKPGRTENRNFGTTLTLNTSYSDFAATPSDDEKLSIERESGRLKFYGEFEQRFVPQLPASNFRQPTRPDEPGLRASVKISPPVSDQEPSDKNAAMTSRYYLEAVYNFRPTLKGKVSFKRAMIDTFESEESLQVEGIVEANRNILIKAGYNNEIRPEVSEPKSNKDTKVWTEFILKF